MFSPEQNSLLSAKLDGSNVKTRSQAGQKLSYIEGWLAIAEANRIFGFDGWDRETVWINCVWSGERQTKSGQKPAASYVARVRITVRAGDRIVIREGTGAGSGFGFDAGEAHESAIKEAETDAMKRALMTFGNPFGLALYDKDKENVMSAQEKAAVEIAEAKEKQKADPSERKAKETAAATFKSAIEMAEDLDELGAWWKKHWTQIDALPDDLKAEIVKAKDACKAHLSKLALQAAE